MYFLSFSLLFACLVGILIGAGIFWISHQRKVGNYQQLASKLLQKAESEAESLKKASDRVCKEKALKQRQELEKMWMLEKKKISSEEERLKKKEDKLDERIHFFEKKKSEVEKKEQLAKQALKNAHSLEKENLTKEKLLLQELEQLSQLSSFDAQELLLRKVQSQVEKDAAQLTKKILSEAEKSADRQATKIITTAIQRIAVPCVSQATTTTISLPHDDMKGRIIGREGRNIRMLEQATGVNIIIDDTPCAITISCFDPIRKEIARLSLTELIQDGRIHPSRIEEVVQNSSSEIQTQIKEEGEKAALQAGILNLHPELLLLLGQLHFRFQCGQSLLKHSLEVSHIMGIMAAELQADTSLAKRIGLLHDIGKAVMHTVEGSHAMIGHDLALKYRESGYVANGIACHHHEQPPETLEAGLCSSANTLSNSRPGARTEAVEEYIKRLRHLEHIANEFSGVEKVFAMQTGRELRIFVKPEEINDDAACNLSRSVAQKVQNEMNLPGKVKITVVREKKAVEYAV